jgi:hypothetical protein
VWHTIYPLFVVIVLADVMFTAAMISAAMDPGSTYRSDSDERTWSNRSLLLN